VIDRIALRSRYGIQGSNALDESEAEMRRQDELWKKFQEIKPGHGLVNRSTGRNVLYEHNIRNEQIQQKTPLLNTGSARNLPGNDIPIVNQPIKQVPLNKDAILVELLVEKLAQQKEEISLNARGGAKGKAVEHDIANIDKTGENKKRPRKDVFIPVLQEGNKKQRVFLKTTDGLGNSEFVSPFDRQPDHLRRYTMR